MIRLNALLSTLQKALSSTLLNQVLDEVALARLNKTLSGLVKTAPKGESLWALSSMVMPYKGHVLTRDLLVSLVCRAFTFKQQIEAGISPSLWEGSPARAAMFCRSVQKVTAKKASLQLNLMCLLGEPAGLKFEVTLSRNFIEYLLGKQLGQSYRKYNSPAEFIAGCYFQCLVQEDNLGPKVAEITATEAMKKLNRKVAEARLSLSKCRTPQLDCSICPKKRKECNLSPYE